MMIGLIDGSDKQTYKCHRIVKVSITGSKLTIGYYDYDYIYHEETNDIPAHCLFFDPLFVSNDEYHTVTDIQGGDKNVLR